MKKALSFGSCDVIVLEDGTYNERIKIASRSGVMIIAEHQYHSGMSGGAIIDGGAAPIDSTLVKQAVIAIYDSAYIQVVGLRIRQDANLFCTSVLPTYLCDSVGIDVRNSPSVTNGTSSHHITISGNELAQMRPSIRRSHAVVAAEDTYCFPQQGLRACNKSEANCIARYDSIPIQIYGGRDESGEATNHIVVENNTLYSNADSSACNGVPDILVSANVSDVLVQSNQIFDSANVLSANLGAIEVRGESDANPFTKARRVIVASNTVSQFDGFGVYVQTANNVLIERNYLTGTTYAVQVTSETPLNPQAHAGFVWIRNNLIENQKEWALHAGINSGSAYGDVHDVYITNNTVLSARIAVPMSGDRDEVVLQDGVTGDSRFANNLVSMTWPGAGTTYSDYLLFKGGTATHPMTAVDDYNLWFVSTYPSFASAPFFHGNAPPWSFNSAMYANSLAADPLVSNYHLSPTSPARNVGMSIVPPQWAANGVNFGDYSSTSFPERDYYGTTRSSPYDIGMEEF